MALPLLTHDELVILCRAGTAPSAVNLRCECCDPPAPGRSGVAVIARMVRGQVMRLCAEHALAERRMQIRSRSGHRAFARQQVAS